MKYENLQEGLVKNYKTLCELLEVPVSEGNSRKAMLRELERHCEYEKQGCRFNIIKVYDEPIPKGDRKDKWLTDISIILLNMLADEHGRSGKLNISLTKAELYTRLGLDNGVEMTVDSYRQLKPMLDIPIWVIEHFLTNSYQLKSSIVASVIKALVSRHLISYKINYLIKFKDGKLREATEEEFKHIEDCFAKVLLSYTDEKKITKGTEAEIWLKKLHVSFYAEVKKKVIEQATGIESYYRVLDIGFHKDIAANAASFKRIHQANDAINRVNVHSIERHKELYRKKLTKAKEKVEQFENGEVEPRENGDCSIHIAKIGVVDVIKLASCYITRVTFTVEEV
jgi:hypothetical protein